MLDRLVQLLESLIDLLSIISSLPFALLHKHVEMADAAVFILLARLVDSMALVALLLALGTLVLEMLH